jgi:hypothetical protein
MVMWFSVKDDSVPYRYFPAARHRVSNEHKDENSYCDKRIERGPLLLLISHHGKQNGSRQPWRRVKDAR